jgi:hypothetical protein
MMRVLAQLRPHPCRAFRFARRCAVDGKPSLHRDLVDVLGMGILYLSGERRVTYANAPAEALLGRGDGLGVDAFGYLRIADPGCADAIGALLCWWGSDVGSVVRTARIVRRGGGRPLQVLLFRPSRAPAELFFGGGMLVMIVVDPDAPPTPRSDAIATAYASPGRSGGSSRACSPDSGSRISLLPTELRRRRCARSSTASLPRWMSKGRPMSSGRRCCRPRRCWERADC